MGNSIKSHALTTLLALMCGFLGAAIWSYSGLADARTKSYLISNPDILPQMADAYQRQQSAQRMAGLTGEVTQAFPGAILGNPNGSKVLVEFTDYNCPYCQKSHADVTKLVESDPDLKVVIREWPIFQGSDLAARMALAAAKQGKFAGFHEAMFRMTPATPETIRAAAQAAGLDLDQAQADGQSPDVEAELLRNASLAQQIGFTGTPSWVAGDQAFEGAVGYTALKRAADASVE
ncbi:thioredoxin domain-containing protein [Erythrobacteraceae bacterium E2-1 Yellow Sea]|nr:thioredoxin domain-containing protein [Erythrobacteraceae bacterium E2-1 Yellow Sea]